MIVRKDHVKARELLQARKVPATASASNTKDSESARSCTIGSDVSDLSSSEDPEEPSLVIVPMSPILQHDLNEIEGVTPEVTMDELLDIDEHDGDQIIQATPVVKNAKTTPMVQSCLLGFQKEPSFEAAEEPSLNKMQDDINKILVTLNDLKLDSTSWKKNTSQHKESLDIGGIKEAKNLLELSGQEDIKIDFLEDGCCITCLPCSGFLKANPLLKM